MVSVTSKVSYWYKQLPKKIVIILIALMAVNYFGYVNEALELAGKSYIDNYNEAYIESVEKQSVKSFVTISLILSTLAIIKSSTAGFSFIFDLNVGYGNIVYPFYLLAEKGWNASFISIAVIEIIKLLLKFSYALSSIFLFGFLIADLSRILLKDINSRVDKILLSSKKLFVFLMLMTYVLIPIYVLGMGFISSKISQPLNEEIILKLENLNKEITPESPEGIASNPKKYAKSIEASFTQRKDEILDASKILIEHTIAAIITAIFIPLTFLLFIYFSYRCLYRKKDLGLHN